LRIDGEGPYEVISRDEREPAESGDELPQLAR
jgi:hypothetical protein